MATTTTSSLGKGLFSLLPESELKGVTGNRKWVIQCNVKDLVPAKTQPREHFDPEALRKLSISIKSQGLIQPLVVREKDGLYEIIAGERRWRASKMAGLKHVPAIVIETNDKTALEYAIVENIQRQNLNPMEEAQAFTALHLEFKLTHSQIAEQVGRDRATVSNTIRLLALPDGIKDKIQMGAMSAGHGRALLAVTDAKKQQWLAREIESKSLSVRQTEALVRQMAKKPRQNQQKIEKSLSPHLKRLEKQLVTSLGTKVSITPNTKNKKKGKIVIEYYSLDQLEELLDPLLDA